MHSTFFPRGRLKQNLYSKYPLIRIRESLMKNFVLTAFFDSCPPKFIANNLLHGRDLNLLVKGFEDQGC
ncbi:MAG: hypothetical protein H5T50_01355 [Nitrososphaeria archaeon]|nr:hypothetical protein [Nitrososphaeria archaeon]